MAENKKISELTKEQEAQLPVYQKKWIDIGLNTDPCDFPAAIKAAKVVYQKVNQPAPFVFFLTNCPYSSAVLAVRMFASVYLTDEDVPKKMVEEWLTKAKFNEDDSYTLDTDILVRGDTHEKVALAAIRYANSKYTSNEQVSKEDIKSKLLEQIYGFQEYWLGFYDFFQQVCKVEGLDCIDGLVELAQVCGWWSPYAGGCIFQHRPLEIHRDDQNRLHHTSKPAVSYRGGKTKVCAVHGILISEKIINKEFSAADIDKESNAEVRRVMIDLYGTAKYLLDTKAQVVNSDDFGTLYRKPVQGDEDIMMVKVVNSTAEPDGTYKDYFIRVDPKAYGGLKTGLAAVASTWRKKDGTMLFAKPEDYNPEIQT